MWSDPEVFFAYSETGGNVLMAAMAERAVKLLVGRSFRNPHRSPGSRFPGDSRVRKVLTGNQNLTKTFTLNSLVSLDLAFWALFFHENRISTFDDLIPAGIPPRLCRPSDKTGPRAGDQLQHLPGRASPFSGFGSFLPQDQIGTGGDNGGDAGKRPDPPAGDCIRLSPAVRHRIRGAGKFNTIWTRTEDTRTRKPCSG